MKLLVHGFQIAITERNQTERNKTTTAVKEPLFYCLKLFFGISP
ncbi:hypothetical protein [Endozoicomonas numazuensis]|nr:hypothetical protein [Endozoicomonas numazuensis]